jgi:hypothetical protein
VTDPRVIAQPPCFPEGGAAGCLPVHIALAPTEGSTIPRMTHASAHGTRPCRTTPVHGGGCHEGSSRSFGRRAGIVHPESPAVRLPQENKRAGGQNRTAMQRCTRLIGYSSHGCLPEGGAAGILPVRGTVAPTEGSTVPRMTHASAHGTRPCPTTPVHGGGCHEGSSRSFGLRAGIVHPESPAVRLPQENKRWGSAEDVCGTTLVHGGRRRGKASRSFGRRAGIVHRESPSVRLPQEDKRWDAGRRSTSPRVFWGRCEPERAVGAAPARRTTAGGPR